VAFSGINCNLNSFYQTYLLGTRLLSTFQNKRCDSFFRSHYCDVVLNQLFRDHQRNFSLSCNL
jgi:hypothetical protein